MGIRELLAEVEHAGEFGVWLGGLDGRAVFTHRADRPHYSASTMKLPVAVAMMRLVESGALDLDQPIRVHNGFTSARAGERFDVPRAEEDAPESWDHLGGDLTLGRLATEMITRSANLPTNLILELTGVDAADQVLQEFGSGPSVIRRCLFDQPAIDAGVQNLMTAADHAAVLVAIGNEKAVGPESSAYLRDLLAANQWNDEIPAGVPAGVRVEHKNGWIARVRHDGGIVRPPDAEPFVLAVFTTSDLPDSEAQQLIADIATVAWDHRHNLAAVR
jgi:beta-lactamase class A